MKLINKQISLLIVIIFMGSFAACAQQNGDEMKPEDTEWYSPIPAKVTPSDDHYMKPPSDAIVLFDGEDVSQWKSSDGGEVPWEVESGQLTVRPGTGDIETRDSFGSFQLYIEWRPPGNDTLEGQDKGNSGIFLQNRYELQVLNAFENPTYVNGMAGSIYKQTAPLVNPSKKPGQWESYNIAYTAPEFNEDGSVASPARVTVIWNGVVVQNNTKIKGNTPYVGLPEYKPHGKAPIRLQDHNSKVSYRNIWIRDLDRKDEE
ncbi:MAG TPA: DUF1080 domain-containing protein [Fodinibius sp.]|nr:DUF1080 domain-containing protein [Fodinibius sp.]